MEASAVGVADVFVGQISSIRQDGRAVVGEPVHKTLNKFFKFVNGVDDNDNLVNKFNIRDLANQFGHFMYHFK